MKNMCYILCPCGRYTREEGDKFLGGDVVDIKYVSNDQNVLGLQERLEGRMEVHRVRNGESDLEHKKDVMVL